MILTILQWNINSYTNNYIELQELIKTHSTKIICLQETHIHSRLNIPINYIMYDLNTSSTRYGGVVILVHKSLEHKLTFTSDDFDVIGMEIKSRMKLNLNNVYFSPSTNFDGSVFDSLFGDYSPSVIVTVLIGAGAPLLIIIGAYCLNF